MADASLPPSSLRALTARYEPATFEPRTRTARIRLAVRDGEGWDVLIEDGAARLVPARGEAEATLSADAHTWTATAKATRGGRLTVRRTLHLGVGFLAATSGRSAPGSLRFQMLATRHGALSSMEAG